jgi:hypothetical protein
MRKFLAGAALALVVGGVAGTAGAEKPHDEPFICNGRPTTIFVHGRVGVIDGVKYLAYNVEGSGSFDPAAPGEPTETFEFTQWTSATKTGGLQCTQHSVNVTDEGTETFDISLNAIAIGKP